MYSVTKRIPFCYGHRLLQYEGKCRHLHGHNGIIEVDVAAEQLNHIGFVRDFSEIKQIIKSWIDDNLDHRMLLCKDDPVVPFLREQKEEIYLMDHNPTAEAIARLIFEYAASQGIPVVEVRLWETPDSFASYTNASH
jgi:6-pyruvoyltetrahydropterin/6-carboxytetrahydropterin synthase